MVFFRAIAKFFREADIFLLALSLFSTAYGMVLINSITRNAVGGNHINVQIGAAVIGLLLFVLFSYVDLDIIADKSVFLLIFSVLFISTLIFWGEGGEEAGVGNNAWLRFFGIGIQPAEVVKIPFIIIIAKMISTFKERRKLNNFLYLIQIVAVFGILFGLILGVSEDLGSAVVYVFILLVMLFVGGVKLRWFLLGGAGVVAAFPFLWNMLEPFQRGRIQAPFVRFFPDLLTAEEYAIFAWQVGRSQAAISNGGVLGMGLGNGDFTQRWGSIPAHHTDFIFAAAGEEFGFVGCIFIVLLLVMTTIRCVYVGAKSNNTLGLLVCTGIAAMLIIHSVINIGMTLGIMPVIGITLPFFSYGGSAIVTCLAAMGIVSGVKMRPKPSRFRTL
ncbi:MAG: FtsW/RodA/SpoVE family cell cycle protein [Oscillospiraceae bacterium]|nr:FtsW/RodA/SpoVE family cell cycle protein [Oscillospiraceae bacterium]